MIRRLHAVDHQLQSVKAKSELLIQTRQQVTTEATALLMSNHDAISSLISVTGAPTQMLLPAESDGDDRVDDDDDEEPTDARQDLEDLAIASKYAHVPVYRHTPYCLDVAVFKQQALSSASLMAPSEGNDENAYFPSGGANDSAIVTEGPVSTKTLSKAATSPTKATGTKNIVTLELTEAKFESVPVSIRGRARFATVKQLHDKMVSYTKAQVTIDTRVHNDSLVSHAYACGWAL
jgi:hypothetical protein